MGRRRAHGPGRRALTEEGPTPLDYAAWRALLKGERLPAAVVDLDAFDRNAERLAARVGPGQTLRVASKSLRVPALLRRVLDRGAPYQGLLCFAAEEVQLLYESGFDDFLLAYPTLQACDLAALRAVHDGGATVRAVVDSERGLRALAAATKGVERPFEAIVDVDVSLRLSRLHLGVRLSPVRNVEDALALFDLGATLPSVRVAGLMAYEAQVAGLGDKNPFKPLINPVVAMIRKRSIPAVARVRQRMADALARRGHRIELFNGAGTGSLDSASREPWLTELAAGSGLLVPHLFDYYSNLDLEPACFFALQAVRTPAEGFVTCLGGSYVASGEAGPDRLPRPCLPAGLQLLRAEGCGEVQTPLTLGPADVQPGDPVLFRHAKAGELAERVETYLLVSGGEVQACVPTHRGLGRCFF